MTHNLLLRAACTAALATALTACGGGGSSPSAPPQPPTPPQVLALSSEAPAVTAGGQAIKLNATGSANINWTLSPDAPGTLSASSGDSVSYQPPAFVTTPLQLTVTARAGSSEKSVTLQLLPSAPAGSISFVAGGTGGAAVVDGSGAQARFALITSIAADQDGSVIVNDRSVLRRVGAGGAVQTLYEANPNPGDGTAGGFFQSLYAAAVGPDRQIYVSYASTAAPGPAIRTLTAQGQLSEVAALPKGDYDAARGRADTPDGLVATAGGKFYARYLNHIVVVENGASRVLAGASLQAQLLDGSGAGARFAGLRDMVIGADGNLYVADGAAVRKVSPAGMVQTIAGAATSGTGAGPRDGSSSIASFGTILSLDVIDARGTLLVLDSAPSYNGGVALRLVAPDGAVSTIHKEAARAYGGANHLLRQTAQGKLVLAAPSRLDRFDLTSAGAGFTALAGQEDDSVVDIDGPAAQARFVAPIALSGDSKGNIYLLERSGLKLVLRKVSADGQVSTLARQDLGNTSSIVADGAGNVYVSADAGGLAASGALYRVTAAGAVQLVAGQPLHAPELRDGIGIQALFSAQLRLRGIDRQGNLYLSDGATATPRKVTAAGAVSSVDRLPDELNRAGDGNVYFVNPLGRIARWDGSNNGVALTNYGAGANLPGPLPGRLTLTPQTPVVPFGKDALLVLAGSAIYKITLPK